MYSLNNQTPATVNQISNNKPQILKGFNVLSSPIANSLNGGFVKPIAYKYVMAGERIGELRFKGSFRMLVPKTPVFQRLKGVIKVYFVPHIRVWKNAEKFLAQNGGSTVDRPKEFPNMGGKSIPNIRIVDVDGVPTDDYIPYSRTSIFTNSWLSTYLPSVGSSISFAPSSFPMPRENFLTVRGWKAICNDYEFNKEYDTPFVEYDTDEVSEAEWAEVTDLLSSRRPYTLIRGRRQNSYYMDYRTELLGEDTEFPDLDVANQPLLELTEWEKKVSSLRSSAENAQKNAWDTIAQIRGSRKLTQGKVQLLGMREFGINYESVSQTTYNVNSDVSEEFQALGQQGAYSFTNIDIPIVQFQEFLEEGFLHVCVQFTADNVYETGVDRTLLNVKYDDLYRPDLKELKNDVLYDIEKGVSTMSSEQEFIGVTGFKRKFSEYFKAPSVIGGDMTSLNIFEPQKGFGASSDFSLVVKQDSVPYSTQKSFTFFEVSDRVTQQGQSKKIWKDYTDLLIEENSAVERPIVYIGDNDFNIVGQNQIFFMAQIDYACDLPIDESIKHNFTEWGEE